jgi:hypothetical protein
MRVLLSFVLKRGNYTYAKPELKLSVEKTRVFKMFYPQNTKNPLLSSLQKPRKRSALGIVPLADLKLTHVWLAQ